MPDDICSFDGCERPRRTRGLCRAHYENWRRRGVLKPLRQDHGLGFWGNVNKAEPHGCWEWLASKYAAGYGQSWYEGKNQSAHRISWQLLVGEIPAGMELDHRCHNRACVNPSHLRLATRTQNAQNLSGANASSQSGVRGVHWDARNRKWRVQIKSSGKKHHGGMFLSLADAEAASKALRAKLFTHDDYDQWAAGNRL